MCPGMEKELPESKQANAQQETSCFALKRNVQIALTLASLNYFPLKDFPHTIIKLEDPSHGTFVLNDKENFIYTPMPDFIGLDSCTVQIVEGNEKITKKLNFYIGELSLIGSDNGQTTVGVETLLAFEYFRILMESGLKEKAQKRIIVHDLCKAELENLLTLFNLVIAQKKAKSSSDENIRKELANLLAGKGEKQLPNIHEQAINLFAFAHEKQLPFIADELAHYIISQLDLIDDKTNQSLVNFPIDYQLELLNNHEPTLENIVPALVWLIGLEEKITRDTKITKLSKQVRHILMNNPLLFVRSDYGQMHEKQSVNKDLNTIAKIRQKITKWIAEHILELLAVYKKEELLSFFTKSQVGALVKQQLCAHDVCSIKKVKKIPIKDWIWSLVRVDNNHVLTGLESGKIILWNTDTLQKEKELNLESSVWSLLPVDDTHMLSGLRNGNLVIWNSKTWRKEKEFNAGPYIISTLLRIDDTHVLSGSHSGDDGKIIIWNSKNWQKEKEVNRFNLGLWDSHPLDNIHVLCGYQSGRIIIFNIKTLESETVLWSGSEVINFVRVDDTHIMSAHKDGKMILWNSITMQQEKVISAGDLVCSLLRLNDTHILSGMLDGNIIVWNSKTWQREKIACNGGFRGIGLIRLDETHLAYKGNDITVIWLPEFGSLDQLLFNIENNYREKILQLREELVQESHCMPIAQALTRLHAFQAKDDDVPLVSSQPTTPEIEDID